MRIFRTLLALVIAIIIITFTLLVFLTADNVELNNKLALKYDFWPQFGTNAEINTLTSVKANDFAPITSQLIDIKATAPELIISAKKSSNILTFEATYTKKADKPKIVWEQNEEGRVTVEMRRNWGIVDLPLMPYENALYEVLLGNLEVPTQLILNLKGGYTEIEFLEAGPETIDIYMDSGKCKISLGESIAANLILSSEYADFEIMLQPNTDYTLTYNLGENAKLTMPNNDVYRHSYGNMESETAQLSINVVTIAGDVSIAHLENLTTD